MATTILQAFHKFKENLEITELQASTVSTRQQSVREVLEKELTVLDSFLTGSYSRSTMIAPLAEADVDIFCVLAVEYFNHYNGGHNGGQGGLLDLVKRALLRTYTRTSRISRNGQAVTISFADFIVDVVPGFHRKGGGFLIPNSIRRNWLATDPRKHVALMTEANKAHNGDLVPLVKMIKGWNAKNGKFFESFHLEVLALAVLNKVTISDYPSAVRYYFDKARVLIAQQNLDPAGYGGDVGSYIDTQEKVEDAVAKFQLAYERALRAESFANKNSTREAIEAWGRIFGDRFPAYG